MDDETRVWDDAFHVDEVVLDVFRGSHKEILDIVVRPSKAKERIWGEQRMVRSLRELADCSAETSTRTNTSFSHSNFLTLSSGPLARGVKDSILVRRPRIAHPEWLSGVETQTR